MQEGAGGRGGRQAREPARGASCRGVRAFALVATSIPLAGAPPSIGASPRGLLSFPFLLVVSRQGRVRCSPPGVAPDVPTARQLGCPTRKAESGVRRAEYAPVDAQGILVDRRSGMGA